MAVAACLLLTAAPAVAADRNIASRITGVSHEMMGEKLRLVLKVSTAPAFTLFTLIGPDRLVIDMPSLVWEVTPEDLTGIPHIGTWRAGLFRPDRARIVIELARPLAVDRAFTEPSHGGKSARLVIDLEPVNSDVFEARSGAPEMARWHGTPPGTLTTRPGEIVIALDPGHGGVDPGASYKHVTEKAITLAFALQLAEELERRPGFRAFMTRDSDIFVPLAERVARAHRAGAHVLISIHADTVEVGAARGMSIYRLSEQATDAAAAALAERENRSDVLAGADLDGDGDDIARLLIELAQRGTKVESAKLAKAVFGALNGQVTMLRTRPMREANFRVLKAPDIPSILLELGFLNSEEDRQRLTDPQWRAEAALLVADGIASWRSVASPGFLGRR
ncbi:MAG: N-acetylmuramoyl-L-alanine amidase [Pseudomonadota bacterium]